MGARGYGRIIQVDSEVVDRMPPGRSAHVTAKSAQIGLTHSWARELAPLGITVNTVAPGFVPVERHADVPGEVRSAYLASVPAGRMGTPADVAHAVSFFSSEAAGSHRPAPGRRRRSGPWRLMPALCRLPGSIWV
jgi:3-oxoacyl-[acyl-carrier protein] reductase